MPKYLWQVSYTTDGVKGLLKEGGTSRRKLVEEMASSLGGKLEAFYFAFGKDDVYCIADLPDDETAAALSLTVAAGGGAKLKTVRLLEPEQIDAATKKSVGYRPPGS